jgi:hypothetical protein
LPPHPPLALETGHDAAGVASIKSSGSSGNYVTQRNVVDFIEQKISCSQSNTTTWRTLMLSAFKFLTHI